MPHSSRCRAGLLIAVLATLISLIGTGCTPLSPLDPQTRPVAELRAVPEPPLSVNALHADLRLPPMHCDLPPVELSAAGQRRFVRAELTCLDQQWAPVLHTIGIALAPANLVVVTSATPGCGKVVEPTDAAFYCEGSVYWPVADPIHRGWGSFLDQYLMFVVMHEYGHHLQSAAGILGRADRDIADAGEQSPPGLAISRRIELQGQCLAAVMLAAAESGGMVTPGKAAHLIETQGDVEEDPTHGTGASSERWAAAGYRSGATSACNTWAADAAEVN